jgi:hypothetical protein
MLTWILAGYLVAYGFTFVFIYSSYVVAARADQLQGLTEE